MNGKLEKMLILAFADSKKVGDGGISNADDKFEALINPETYTLEYKVKTAEGQGQGTSSVQTKFAYTIPEELTFDFLFDNTGIINGKPQKDNISEEVKHFRELLFKYRGTSHEPYHLKLVWGNLVFQGRATELGMTYKLFNPGGHPIRAVAKVKFKGSIEEDQRKAREARQSPDLTHRYKVKAGDTLPLMCHRIYGDPKYYLDVARANGLHDFRSLRPGTNLVFPPLQKTTN